MKKNPVLKAIAMLLAVVFCIGVLVIPAAAANEPQSAADARLEDMLKYLDTESYQKYVASYAQKPLGDKEYTAVFSPTASSAAAGVLTLDQWKVEDGTRPALDPADFRTDTEMVYSPAEGETSYTLTVDTEGMYYIVVEYYNTRETINAVERKLYIDDKLPFSEASAFSMTKTWAYTYLDGETGSDEDNAHYAEDMEKYGQAGFRHDVNGNDLTPSVDETSVWRTYICSSSNGYATMMTTANGEERFDLYYRFYLSAGTHTLTFDAIREGAVFGSVKAVPAQKGSYKVPTYEEYLADIRAKAGLHAADVVDSDNTHIMIPAEFPDLVSDSSVAMTSNKNSCITTPSHPSHDKYNVIGANSYNSVGQWAAYEFTPSVTGLYSVTMRYLQNVLDGMFISRAVKITSHGEGTYIKYGIGDTPTIPFAEAYSTRFNYSKDWTVASLTDGESDFRFFFEQGVTYTIYFEVSLGALSEELQRVENALEELNDCYLQILRLTGPNPDENADYGFQRMIPDTLINLCVQAKTLQDVRDNFARICGVEQAAHLATMDNIIRQLVKMGTDEDEIASGLAELKTSLGSLGTWISESKASTLIVDYISVQSPEAENGKANANFFQTAWHEIRAFFSSFGTNYDMMGVTNEKLMDSNPLEVWQATGRDQNKVVRNMIDADFADYCLSDTHGKQEEIPVALKLVTGGTLLPSILAGKGPDVYMGLDAGSIMNFALRGAILPVNDMSDFAIASADFHKAALDSIKLPALSKDTREEDLAKLNDPDVPENEKWNIYGLPMTMSFAMMFYRMDFLVEQGAGVPQTWDELLALLPTLQENNMDIGMNYTLALDFFLYQKGGNMWQFNDKPAYAGALIGLDTTVGRVAFEYCTTLYSDYSFPVYYDAANRFRTGEMPIVIQDYVSTYNQLIVFATEIEGLWAFSHIPGEQQYDEQGNKLYLENGKRDINYTSMASITAAVITSNGADRKDEAWQYMKWCTDDKYISDYSNRIVSILGPSAKYASASRTALKNMSWTSAERVAIEEQMDQLDTIVNYPGSYYIGRNTNFAFLAAVNDGKDAIESLDKYIDAINAEISRKREEFGLPTLKPGEQPE